MTRLLRLLVRHVAWLTVRLDNLEERVTTNQEHLDADIAGIQSAFGDAIQHLKDQIAAGAQANALDFSKADALLASAQAEDAADTPAAPSAPADGASSGSAPAGSAPASSDSPAPAGDSSTPVDGSASAAPADGSATPSA